MAESVPFISTMTGQLRMKAGRIQLLKLGIPDDGDNSLSMVDFQNHTGAILVPAAVKDAPKSKEMEDAIAAFQDIVNVFVASLEADHQEAEDIGMDGRLSGSPSAVRVDVTGPAAGAAISFSSAGGAGTSSSSSSAGATGGSTDDGASGSKRPRLGMSEADLARACTVMNMPGARATPQFLVDKPLDVRMYTPLLVELYGNVRKVAEGISLLAREVLVFEGDFLELSPSAVAALPTTPLFESCDKTSGSRLLHRL